MAASVAEAGFICSSGRFRAIALISPRGNLRRDGVPVVATHPRIGGQLALGARPADSFRLSRAVLLLAAIVVVIGAVAAFRSVAQPEAMLFNVPLNDALTSAHPRGAADHAALASFVPARRSRA